jgi:hypothetical protein
MDRITEKIHIQYLQEEIEKMQKKTAKSIREKTMKKNLKGKYYGKKIWQMQTM